ncbi:hypothetical protein NDK43_22535 [Neobacillus pocheonensis]|uniref:Uncharacterized protein n=1 Tax=Neobacillus pocheonensis TaxID=363869 RepID=A0ABT0WG77_9BACI|nr:hypothetical protein [Neobacillus pocheonensis]
MIEGKGLGNKKVNRVGLSLSNRYDNKLRKLTTACNLKHTTLAGILLEKSLDNIQLVHEMQKDNAPNQRTGYYQLIKMVKSTM